MIGRVRKVNQQLNSKDFSVSQGFGGGSTIETPDQTTINRRLLETAWRLKAHFFDKRAAARNPGTPEMVQDQQSRRSFGKRLLIDLACARKVNLQQAQNDY